METFNGNKGAKQRLITLACSFAPRILDNNKDRTREKLFWSEREWCEPTYVCQKGKDCDHRFYADQIGVPVGLAYAERAVFLDLPTAAAKKWWPAFLDAIPVGVTLSEGDIMRRIAIEILSDSRLGMLANTTGGDQHGAVSDILDLFVSGETDPSRWKAAADKAMRVYHKSPYNNNRMKKDEARKHQGCVATRAACYLARAAEDPRRWADAVSEAGWVFRYKGYADHLSTVGEYTGQGGNSISFGQWMAATDRGDLLGEIARASYIEWVSRLICAELRKSDGSTKMERFLRFFSGRQAA